MARSATSVALRSWWKSMLSKPSSTPYTADTLAALGREGVARVDVICPGFAADCLETLEEIAQEGRKIFLEAGGKEFHYIPTTNDTPSWMTALTAIAAENL